VTGSRTGGDVSLALAEVLPFTGTNGPCDTISFSFPVAFSIARIRTSYCGDGGLDAGEACDDGNFGSGDACSAACTLPQCGNGVVEGTEACDDGNAVNGDGCATTCEANVCGNGVVEPGEQCDDGNTTNGDGCSPTCQMQGCGNGVVESGEVCDDGNTVSGDGCSDTCAFEGCPLTGTWSGGPGGPMTWSLVEDGAGGIVGVAFTPGAPASALSVAGTRTGGSVSLSVAGAILFTGTNGPCDTIAFSGSFPVAFSIARVRASYCGDGALDPADEACDDGNIVNDACTVACGAPSGCGDGLVDPGEPCDDGNGANTDGCLAGCLAAACGDGWVRAGVETCDDGNDVPGDGCAPDCTLESEASSGAVGGGTLTVTTDTESGGDGATPSDPIETALSAPSGTISGTLAITEQAAPPTPQPGFVFLGALVTLSAVDLVPPPAAATPLVVTFQIDASQIPGGQDEASIVVQKDGAQVPPCAGAAGEASPDPCVAARERLADGDVRLTVLTSTLSDWGFAASVCGSAPLLGCRAALPGRARLKMKERGGKDLVAWNWRNDLVAPKSLFGDPLAGTDYTLCVYDGTGLVLQQTAPAGGTCGSKACWKPTPSGFRYRNGTAKMVLKAGDPRRAKATTKASGPLALPGLPLEPPVRAQLRPKDGACLDAGFSTPAVNDTRTFRAVGD
jgi:cysteine-rich repeat protein